MVFIVATLATALCLWRFSRTAIVRWWDEGTLRQHRLLFIVFTISLILFICTVIYALDAVRGDWNSEPPFFAEVILYFTIQFVVIAALATENRGKRLKRINKHRKFKAMLKQQKPPPVPQPEPTAEERIRELIQKNKR
jgi:high-affinity K+ transport system ATPase subunit B